MTDKHGYKFFGDQDLFHVRHQWAYHLICYGYVRIYLASIRIRVNDIANVIIEHLSPENVLYFYNNKRPETRFGDNEKSLRSTITLLPFVSQTYFEHFSVDNIDNDSKFETNDNYCFQLELKRLSQNILWDLNAIPIFNINNINNTSNNLLSFVQKSNYTKLPQQTHETNIKNYCLKTKTSHLYSFMEMLHVAEDRNIKYSEHFIAYIIKNVLKSVCLCHKHNIVNLNVDLTSLGFDQCLRPVLLDFSRAFTLEKNETIKEFRTSVRALAAELSLMLCGDSHPIVSLKICGDLLRYADMFHVGVLLYQLVTGVSLRRPSNLNDFTTSTLDNELVAQLEEIKCSQELRNLLSKLLDSTFFNRLDSEKALHHPWLKNNTKIKLENYNYDNIDNLFKIEKIREYMSWISVYTRSKYNVDKEFERDYKYFSTIYGQKLGINESLALMQDRMGYCLYSATTIIEQLKNNYNSCSVDSICIDDNGEILWQDFRNIYINLRDRMNKDCAQQFTNAIFKEADKQGKGYLSSSILKSLFNDIGLDTYDFVPHIASDLETMSFQQVYDRVRLAIKLGFDFYDLLLVDHKVVGA